MVDLLYPPAGVPSASSNSPNSVKEGTIAQAILRLMPQPPQHEQEVVQGTLEQAKAMQALVRVVAELRQLVQEGKVNQPQTPKGLAPYVEVEVQSVIDALQTQPNLGCNPSMVCSEALLGQENLELKTVVSWLLWGIARSSHQVMQLLEGSIAQLLSKKQLPQTGMIRLAALVEFKLPNQTYTLDLATHSLTPTLLPSEQLVQLPDSALTSQPQSVGDLLKHLTTQVQDSTAIIRPFFTGVPVELLIPGHPWQQGKLRLYLGLEFVPQSTASQPAAFPHVRMTNSAWASRYADIVAQQELAHRFPHLSSIQTWQQNPESVSMPDWQISLITDACNFTDWLQRSLTFLSRVFMQEAFSFEDLTQRLLWCFSRTGYRVMQWMGEASVQVLEPESHWMTGTLRYVIKLQASTPELDWEADLMTGQPPTEGLTIHPEAILRFSKLNETQCLCQMAKIEAEILQTIEQAAPELQQLLHGIEIDLQREGEQWQPGILRLETGFVFRPN
ncbi:MAG TPA: hypothetical protein V6D10_19145 [Trichocoleus sp.]|jgi:hypothetical protein